MLDYKKIRNLIQDRVRVEDTTSILESFGYEFKRVGVEQYQFKDDNSFTIGYLKKKS